MKSIMMVGEISATFQQMLSVNKRPLVPASLNKLISLSRREVPSQVEEHTTGTRAYSRVVINAHSQIGPLFEHLETGFFKSFLSRQRSSVYCLRVPQGFLSLSPSLSLSLTLALSLSLCLSVCVCLCLSLPLSLCLYLSCL